jgi:hypothetical protein
MASARQSRNWLARVDGIRGRVGYKYSHGSHGGLNRLAAALSDPGGGAQASVVAATPSMGWSSWNHFAGKIDDASVRAQADAMVTSGMRDAGISPRACG